MLAENLTVWLKTICNKEVPDSVFKELNETFIPKEELQPIFVAPALPAAVNTKLYTAPKSISRIPKLINFTVLRAQRELCIAYKPLIEVLNFFYSEEHSFMIETIPQARSEFARLKLLISQSLAIVMSAALKLSISRKHALRPLLKSSSSGILRHQPTSEHVLGTSDLASLSEQASKEYRAMSGVFRPDTQYKSRLRTPIRYFNRNLHGIPYYNNQYRFYNKNQGYQGYQGKNQYPRKQRARPKNRHSRSGGNKQ